MTSTQHRSHKDLVPWQKSMRLTTRQTTREFLQFLHIARGSSAELETQLLVAGDLG
jgi:hypothetical protein